MPVSGARSLQNKYGWINTIDSAIRLIKLHTFSHVMHVSCAEWSCILFGARILYLVSALCCYHVLCCYHTLYCRRVYLYVWLKASTVFESADTGDILCAVCPHAKLFITAGTSSVTQLIQLICFYLLIMQIWTLTDGNFGDGRQLGNDVKLLILDICNCVGCTCMACSVDR